MRYKQILGAAADNPDASVEELGSMVPSATADFVERVLEEHGDPAAEDHAESNSGEHTAKAGTDGQSGANATGENISAPATDSEPADPPLTTVRVSTAYISNSPTTVETLCSTELSLSHHWKRLSSRPK